jgi:oxaloacetate decarboxylase alpha subunit/pyruvate carboxylase subunit B
MKKKLLIRDLTLRDGQQSMFATRMSQAQVDRVLPLFKHANFYAMEVWGGAIPDSIMRYLNEDPWDRLEKIKSVIGNSSKLTALSRGRNLFGYNPYPDEVIEGFIRNSMQSGLDIMRIFDALNDLDNMKSTIKFVKQHGGIADCAVCFTVDPSFSVKEKVKARLAGRKIPRKIFTTDYFIKKAKELEKMGADMISIKDMAGLISPHIAGPIIKGIKKSVKIPVDLHTHCTPGYGLASVLVAMVYGADIVDTVIMPFSGGPAAPAFELIQIFANKLGLETDVNLKVIPKIAKELKVIRKELEKFDEMKIFPKDFDITKDQFPKEIEKYFDKAIKAAKDEDYDKVLEHCQEIEKYFNFPPPDDAVRVAQIPGGMYTNMLAQLKQAKLEHLLDKVLKAVPQVRLDGGLPPLVTPTSQIVGVQAVSCVIDESKGQPFYTTKTNQYVNLVKGTYGKTPFSVDPEFREKLAGVKKETPYDTRTYQKQDNPKIREYGDILLAKNEKEELLLELFPMVAKDFLRKKREQEYLDEMITEQKKKFDKIEEERKKYLELDKKVKEELLLEGLYNNW